MGSLTAVGDGGLLDGRVIQDGTSAEDLQVVLAIVGDDGLDLSISSRLELDIERSRGRRSSGGQSGESSKTSKELHSGGWRLVVWKMG